MNAIADGGLAVTLPRERWQEFGRFAREELGCRYFNWLSAVDWKDQGLEVLCRVENLDAALVLTMRTRLAAGETACPTLTEGRFEYDFGDEAGMTPKILMYTLGHEFIPPPIHAGGLRYHGDAPIICNLVKNGWMDAVAYPQGKVFEAALQFARTQGIIPAPETAHAIRAAIDEALAAKEAGEERVILFNYSGHGLLDLAAYDAFLHGQLVDV